MGGYKFKDLHGDIIFGLNLGCRAIWLEILKDSKNLNTYDENIRCCWDKDDECFTKGCLQDQLAGYIHDRTVLLQINKRALKFLQQHPEWETEQHDTWAQGSTDRDVALSVLNDFIKALEKSDSKKIVTLDRLFNLDIYPCPRCVPLKKGNTIDITHIILPYEKAIEMKENGMWQKRIEKIFSPGNQSKRNKGMK